MSKWDLIWPRLEAQCQEARRSRLESDLRDIEGATWQADPEKALAVARADEKREDERRATADTKASNFLLAIVTLIPLLTYLESIVWEHRFGAAPRWLGLCLLVFLGISVLFLLGAGRWAFKALNVSTYHKLSAAECKDIWQTQNRNDRLINEIFKNTRRNSEVVNDKVSCIKMTHIFLGRSILFFGLLTLTQVGWSLYEEGEPSVAAAISGLAGNRPAAVNAPPSASTTLIAGTAMTPEGCNPQSLALRKATDEMNEVDAGKGFHGSIGYWVQLGTSLQPKEQAMGRAWEIMRQLYVGVFAVECEANRMGASDTVGGKASPSVPSNAGASSPEPSKK